MKGRIHFPLMAKVFGWLLLHLLFLVMAFTTFVRWQLHLGLDSLLSGSAGDRLSAFADHAAARISQTNPAQWNDAIAPLARQKKVQAYIFEPENAGAATSTVPPNVIQKIRDSLPPPPRGRPPRMRPRPMNGNELEEILRDPDIEEERNRRSRPVFLIKGSDQNYWAGVSMVVPPRGPSPDRHVLLLIKAASLDGSGMFFDIKPWLWGGAGVLVLSLAIWAPFVWRISHYLRRLSSAADQIAAGRFLIEIPSRRDELGLLGQSIESMALRLDHLIAGQKRFLGDAAHEFCAPLARIRAALGILENKLALSSPDLLQSIESDTAELASLVEEILSFARAGNSQPCIQQVFVKDLIHEVIQRECPTMSCRVDIPEQLSVAADVKLLRRAMSNLIRNTMVHAGIHAEIIFQTEERNSLVLLHVTDTGPGVPVKELSRIFEPFHRLDPARGRETGGTGLGLAIVRTCIEACGGEVSAQLSSEGGLQVRIKLPQFPNDSITSS